MNGKYGNRRIVAGDGVFDSAKEYRRWCELRIMERAGEIKALRRQVPYELIPAQKDEHGKVIERAVKYIADFEYLQYVNSREWVSVVEDVKGMKTDVYKIKKKLMLERYGIRIQEV